MGSQDLLPLVKEHQKHLLLLEKEIRNLQNEDYLILNEKLKREIYELSERHEKLKVDHKELIQQKKELKDSLMSEVYNNRLIMIRKKSEQIDLYFDKALGEEVNKLERIEQSTFNEIDGIIKDNQRIVGLELKTEFENLEKIKTTISQKRDKHIANVKDQKGYITDKSNHQLNHLNETPLTEEQLEKIKKQNNFEQLLGLNVINKLGILLLIFGGISLGSVNYTKITDPVKSILLALLAVGLLVVGEYLNGKNRSIFSMGITSGAIALMHTTTAISYFGFEILSVYPAITLVIFVTIIAFILAKRYDSEVIAIFANIGGFLPLFAIFENPNMFIPAMIYFSVLSIFVIGYSTQKYWKVATAISYALSVLTIFVISNQYQDTATNQYAYLYNLIFVFTGYLTYLVVPLIGKHISKLNYTTIDKVISVSNFIISQLLVYLLIGFYDVDFAKIYVAGAFIIINSFVVLFLNNVEDETNEVLDFFTIKLFTSFTILFLVLFKGLVKFSVIEIECASLLVYSYFKKNKIYEYFSYALLGLVFILYPMLAITGYGINLLTYTVQTLCLLSIVAGLYYSKRYILKKSIDLIFMYAGLLSIFSWFYFVIINEIQPALFELLSSTIYNPRFIITYILVCVLYINGYIFKKLTTILRINGLFSLAFSLKAILLSINLSFYNLNNGSLSSLPLGALFIVTLGFGILLIGSIFSINSTMKLFQEEYNSDLQIPIVISSFGLLYLTSILVNFYDFAINSLAISFIYLSVAIFIIIYGFKKRLSSPRRFGLALTLISLAKLFIVDLYSLTGGYRIASYFIFGLVFIGISYIYQYFTNLVENQEQ